MAPNLQTTDQVDVALSPSDKVKVTNVKDYGSLGQEKLVTKEDESKSSPSPLFGSYRLFVVLLGSLVLCWSFASQTSMSSAMVCMIDEEQLHKHHHHYIYDTTTTTNNSVVHNVHRSKNNNNSSIFQGKMNSTVHLEKIEEDDWKFSWNSETQGWLVSSFFLGYYIMQIPSGVIVTRLGPKGSLVIGTLATGVFHLLSIPAARWSLPMLFVVRTLAGLACGCMLPATFGLVANWCPRQETSMLFAITSNGIDLGSSFSFILSLFGCETDFQGGWSIVFYVLGFLHLLLGASILLCITDFPSTNSYISSKESRYISDHRPHDNNAEVIPLGQILRSRPVWAFIVAQFATDWVIFMVVTQGPRFLQDILHLPHWKTSMLSSFPFLTSMPFGILIGYMSKKAVDTNFASTTRVRQFTETFAKIMCAVPLAVLMVLPEGEWVSVFVLYSCVAIGIAGTYSGFMANPGDLSPGHAGFVASLGQALSMWAGFVIPVFTTYMTREKTRDSWQLIFAITIGIELFSIIFYLSFGSGALQPWAFYPKGKEGAVGEHSLIVEKGGNRINNGDIKRTIEEMKEKRSQYVLLEDVQR